MDYCDASGSEVTTRTWTHIQQSMLGAYGRMVQVVVYNIAYAEFSPGPVPSLTDITKAQIAIGGTLVPDSDAVDVTLSATLASFAEDKGPIDNIEIR